MASSKEEHRRHIIESLLGHFRNKRFDWETNNCAIFTSVCLKQLWNLDIQVPGFNWVGKTKKEFLALLIEKKVTLSELAEDQFGKPLQGPGMASIGDLLVEGEGLKQNLGMCVAPDQGVFMKERGLVRISLAKCSYAWSMKNHG
jgi:hypothetical protein